MHLYDVLRKPLITEKAARKSEEGVYVFFVSRSATKHSVADAIELTYGVRPERIRIAKCPAKNKRTRISGRRREHGKTIAGKTAERKKAYVFLKKGDTIQLT